VREAECELAVIVNEMTEHEENLKQYVEQMAKLQRSLFAGDWVYRGVEDVVSKIGRFDVASPLPADIKRGKAKLCFMNAFRLMSNGGYVYVEGIAMPANTLFPVHHGWCVDASNRVIDPTWHEGGVAYLGVHLNKSFVYQRALQRKKYGVFGDSDSFDLYEKGLPQDAIQP
jgi:hypothetical protein